MFNKRDIGILYLRTDKRLKEEEREKQIRVKLQRRIAHLEHLVRILMNKKNCCVKS